MAQAGRTGSRNRSRGVAAGAVGTVAWGFTGIFVKLVGVATLPADPIPTVAGGRSHGCGAARQSPPTHVALVSIAGVATVAVGARVPSGHTLVGDALAVGSLLAFTGYWLVSKRAGTGSVGAGQYTAGVMIVAALAMAPVACSPIKPSARSHLRTGCG